MSKDAVATPTSTKKEIPMVIVETPLPGGNDVLRKLVPANTDPEDIPEGATMLTPEETTGILRKQTKPEVIRVGDRVRRKPAMADEAVNEDDQGYVDAQLKRDAPSGAKYLRVKWEKSNQTLREDPADLHKIW